MKLNVKGGYSQGDPYVIKEGGRYYMYATHPQGVQLYDSDDMINWTFRGFCLQVEGQKEYWAPCVIKLGEKFYMYYSSFAADETDVHKERVCVAVSDSPDGRFLFVNELIAPFSIDPHVVISGGELFIYYSLNDYDAPRAGTLVVVDKLVTPLKALGEPKVVVRATLDEEIFQKDRFKKGQHWHTIEGAFYFRIGDWHYLTYSGNCYENPTYYVGYCACHSAENDLTKLDFKKYPNENTYLPLIAKNSVEEGTGHNSALIDGGKIYVFYHGRDVGAPKLSGDTRTARLLTLVANGDELKIVER